MIADNPTRFTMRLDDGGSVEVRVMARPIAVATVADVARVDYFPRSRTAVIQVSDRADREAIERAMHRKIAELKQQLNGAAGEHDLLAAGVRPGVDARLSVRDAGRLGELRWLARRAGAVPGNAGLARELAAMVEALGLRGGVPGARRRVALAGTRLGEDVMDLLAPFHRGREHARLRDGLTDADLCELDLSGAVLRGGRLARLAAARSRWCSADLRGTSFEDVDLSSADLTDVDAAHGALFRTRLNGARARAIVLDEVRITDCDLTGCDLRGASLAGAVVTGCSLRGARLGCEDGPRVDGQRPSARFIQCDFRGADLDGRELMRVELVDCMPGDLR